MNDVTHWQKHAVSAPVPDESGPTVPRDEHIPAVHERLQELTLAQLLTELDDGIVTSAEVARRLGVSRSAVSQTSHRPLASLTIGKLSEYLDANGYRLDLAAAIRKA